MMNKTKSNGLTIGIINIILLFRLKRFCLVLAQKENIERS